MLDSFFILFAIICAIIFILFIIGWIISLFKPKQKTTKPNYNSANESTGYRYSQNRVARQSVSFETKPVEIIDKTIGLALYINFAVKGLSYLSVDNHEEARSLMIGDELALIPEPDNVYDSDAVRVSTLNAIDIGYVEAYRAERVKRIMETSSRYFCCVSKITNHYIPYIYASIYYKTDLEMLSAYDKKIEEEREAQSKKLITIEPEIKTETKTTIIYDDPLKRINQLQQNIKRNEIAVLKHLKNNKTHLAKSALSRIEKYTQELNILEEVKKEHE